MNTPSKDDDPLGIERLLASVELYYHQNPSNGPEVHFGMLSAFVNGTMTDPHEREVVNRAIETWHHWSEAFHFLESRYVQFVPGEVNPRSTPAGQAKGDSLPIEQSSYHWEPEFKDAISQKRLSLPDERDWPLLMHIYRTFRNSAEGALRPRDFANATDTTIGLASEMSIRRFAKQAIDRGLLKSVRIQSSGRAFRGTQMVDAFAPIAGAHQLLARICLVTAESGQVANWVERIHELAEAIGIPRGESDSALIWSAKILDDLSHSDSPD
jgi:hypothetical protein